ncbi:MAG: glutamate racemase [Flavobacteriales bacterium]|jgi:glutamate racemase
MDASQAIGVFDSGIGGLTVANAIKSVMPNERLIYFGDTAHLPYGEKSEEAVKHFSERISQFLLGQKCKAIVIACNTASSLAYEHVLECFGDKAIIFNVIDPVADSLADLPAENIGVIGTRATVNSDIYRRKIVAKNPLMKVKSLATPLLAHIIEEGFFNNTISEAAIHEYLEDPKLQGIDKLILACTHYPLIQKQIDAFYKGKVKILNSADLVAHYIRKGLSQEGLCANKRSEQKDHFFVSDYTESFNASARMFFQEEIHLESCPIWL